MSHRTLQSATTAEAVPRAAQDRGIDVFLGNAGTDFASLVEAFAAIRDRRDAAAPIVVPHEFVAVRWPRLHLPPAAPAAVMVHVNVGTATPSTAIITAARRQTCPS